MTDAKEDAVRLQGVTWIDAVRRALSLPIRTFNTAVTYYHKFRLLHSDAEYNWADASAAALFTACKIEDTLKKSREILCAAWNLKVGAGEALSSDDPRFDTHSKQIIGLERLMLESAGFDFRNRYPQKVMVKLARAARFDRNNEGKTAWNLSVDLYRTFAPLKQSTPTLAIACLELAARLHERDAEALVDKGAFRYAKWGTSRGEVMGKFPKKKPTISDKFTNWRATETLLDLLDLYTHHRSATSLGPLHPLETFINIRITLNNQASRLALPRFTPYASSTPPTNTTTNTTNTTSPATPAVNGLKPRNGVESTTPNTPNTPGTVSPAQADAGVLGGRGQGTVRFMLDAARARDERAQVEAFYRVEEEVVEVEVANERFEEGEREREREARRVR
jgi:CTD kinase subunit beta